MCSVINRPQGGFLFLKNVQPNKENLVTKFFGPLKGRRYCFREFREKYVNQFMTGNFLQRKTEIRHKQQLKLTLIFWSECEKYLTRDSRVSLYCSRLSQTFRKDYTSAFWDSRNSGTPDRTIFFTHLNVIIACCWVLWILFVFHPETAYRSQLVLAIRSLALKS